MTSPSPPWLARLLRRDVHWWDDESHVVQTVDATADLGSASRFDGLYGLAYDAMIKRRATRCLFFGLWGSAEVLYDLERFVRRVVEQLGETMRQDGAENVPILLDVPCGGGTVLPFLRRADFHHRVVEFDLSSALLATAQQRASKSSYPFDIALVRGDALNLPFDDDSIDGAISINGLHVMPDPARFLTEIARVLRPDGRLWMITPVSATAVRSRVILRIAKRWGVISQLPPTLDELRQLCAEAGFAEREWLGGTSITGMELEQASTPNHT
ncbi:MAG: methyltransferase type 11 [Thermoleophilia bacterium]|nr:methyltransferase type 11 [Thermoleophilia bacterium]